MLKIVLIVLFYKTVFAYPELGIIGGQDAVDGQIPYQVSIQICDWFSCQHNCGGSIIDTKWIVTAGHCYSYGQKYQVMAGSVKLSHKDNYTQIVKVKAAHVHPDFIGNANPNDICLMELEEPLTLNDRIQAVALPEAHFETTGSANTSGWGLTSTGLFPKKPDNLQWLETNILEEEECQKEWNKALPYQRNPYDKLSNICIANPDGKHVVCQGDSGSPLTQEGKLIGLTSWGMSKCDTKMAPSVFTKVSNFIGWIKSVTGDAV